MRTIITGAAGGIGAATARALGTTGLRLVAVDRDAAALHAAAEGLRRDGAEVTELAGDLGDPAFCDHVVDRARSALGGLDVLVSNAGVLSADPLSTTTVQEWDRVLDVNVRAGWLLARGAHPMLRDSRGSVVMTGSIAGHHPIPSQGPYGVSKAALGMLVRQLANEWAGDGVRVNAVSPGMVVTGMSAHLYPDDETRRRRGAVVPLGTVADPDQVAAVIAFLAGPAASYVTGQDLMVDGGLDTALMTTVRSLAVATAGPGT